MAAHLDRVGTQADRLDRRLRGPRQLDDRKMSSAFDEPNEQVKTECQLGLVPSDRPSQSCLDRVMLAC